MLFNNGLISSESKSNNPERFTSAVLTYLDVMYVCRIGYQHFLESCGFLIQQSLALYEWTVPEITRTKRIRTKCEYITIVNCSNFEKFVQNEVNRTVNSTSKRIKIRTKWENIHLFKLTKRANWNYLCSFQLSSIMSRYWKIYLVLFSSDIFKIFSLWNCSITLFNHYFW